MERSMSHLYLLSWMTRPTVKETPGAKRCVQRNELTHGKAQHPCKGDLTTRPLLVWASGALSLPLTILQHSSCTDHVVEIICGPGLWLPGQLQACGQPPQERKRAAAPVRSAKYERRKRSKCHCVLSQATKNRAYQSFRQGLHSSFKHIQVNRLC